MRLLPVLLGVLLVLMLSGSSVAQMPSVQAEQQAAIDEALDMFFNALLAINGVLLIATILGVFRSMRIRQVSGRRAR